MCTEIGVNNRKENYQNQTGMKSRITIKVKVEFLAVCQISSNHRLYYPTYDLHTKPMTFLPKSYI